MEIRNLTDGVIEMFFNGFGSIGFGTTSPQRKVHISDAASETSSLVENTGTGIPSLRLKNPTYEFRQYLSQSGVLVLQELSTGARPYFITSTRTTINPDGANYDFFVEGDNDPNLLVTDAANDRVGIGTATPSEKLEVNGTIKISGDMLKMSGITTTERNALTAVAIPSLIVTGKQKSLLHLYIESNRLDL